MRLASEHQAIDKKHDWANGKVTIALPFFCPSSSAHLIMRGYQWPMKQKSRIHPDNRTMGDANAPASYLIL